MARVALHRAPAHALALFGTPGNFRLKRRGVGFEKRGNCRGFTRGCHGLPLGLRLGLAVFSLIAANCQFAKHRIKSKNQQSTSNTTESPFIVLPLAGSREPPL